MADFARHGSFATLSEILRYNGGKMSHKTLAEMAELMSAIEGAAVICLAESHTGEDIKALRESLGEIRAVIGKEISPPELAAITCHFHTLICDLSGNNVFSLIMNAFSPMSMVLWESCTLLWGAEDFLEQDSHIIDLIENGNGCEAQRYIESIFKQFLAAYNGAAK